MKILYVSSSRNANKPYEDSSVRYRCFNPAQVLSTANITADVTTIDKVLLNMVERYDLMIFHRPPMSRKLEKLVNRAKQKGCVVIADFDDLIFNPDYADQSPGFLNGQHQVESVKASFTRIYDALFLFDHFTVSTFPLSVEIKKLRPSAGVSIIHNFLSDIWLQCSSQPSPEMPKMKRITYLPGTNSHHHDFSLIENVLGRFLSKNTDAVLRIVGPLKFKKNKYHPRQLERLPLVPYPLLPRLIQDSWVTIAPLADTLFNNCKSGLKYFESAAFGVPVIATPIDDMHRLSSEALHLADTRSQWIKALSRLSDKTYYEQCAVSGVNHVKDNCVISCQMYQQFYSNLIA